MLQLLNQKPWGCKFPTEPDTDDIGGEFLSYWGFHWPKKWHKQVWNNLSQPCVKNKRKQMRPVDKGTSSTMMFFLSFAMHCCIDSSQLIHILTFLQNIIWDRFVCFLKTYVLGELSWVALILQLWSWVTLVLGRLKMSKVVCRIHNGALLLSTEMCNNKSSSSFIQTRRPHIFSSLSPSFS